mgnify:CR=1 FL=1
MVNKEATYEATKKSKKILELHPNVRGLRYKTSTEAVKSRQAKRAHPRKVPNGHPRKQFHYFDAIDKWIRKSL